MATSRKLLILDLNGTLLVRGSHAKRKPSTQLPIPLGVPLVQNLRLRAVHGRPYLPSFREYLFHAETKKWLDTMVWSSAQPHSVADMVQHCFADTKEGFLAIWARDTLGLSQKAYNLKTQTMKDLVKPWAAFPMHSAKTTLLLDDSVLKAQLQPWNHLCIPEYVSGMRAKDLEMLKRSCTGAAPSQLPVETDIAVGGAHASTPTSSLITKALGSFNGGASLKSDPLEGTVTHKYDEALLAVIGILEHIKDEPNVGKWIRSGGLHVKAPSPSEPVSVEHGDTKCQESNNFMSLKDIGDAISSIGTSTTSQVTASMWFDHGNLMDIWASRGRRVLDELHIDVTSGIKA